MLTSYRHISKITVRQLTKSEVLNFGWKKHASSDAFDEECALVEIPDDFSC